MKTLALLLLVVAMLILSGCTILPEPSPWRRRLLEEGSAKDIAVDGRKIHVIDRGAGPTVLLLHGLGGSAYDFRYQIDALVQAGYRVIIPDMIGAGYSDKPLDWDYTLTSHTETMVKLLDALGVAKAHVGGNSYGGGVAIGLALMVPDRVDRLILIDAVAYPQEIPWHVKMLRLPVIGDLAVTVFPPRWAAKILINECLYNRDAVTEEDVVEYVHEHRFVGSGRTLRRMAERVDDPSVLGVVDKIKEIRHKTLVVWGREDQVLLPASGDRLHAEIQGSTLVTVPFCGHVPHMEYPSLVNRLILEFLRTP